LKTGLDLFGGLAFVRLAHIRETPVFAGLPLDEHRDELRCGVAVVDCQSGQVVATLFFKSGVEEIFDVRVVPGYRTRREEVPWAGLSFPRRC
jgi:uncharacterized protein (TIGR03032 family)